MFGKKKFVKEQILLNKNIFLVRFDILQCK